MRDRHFRHEKIFHWFTASVSYDARVGAREIAIVLVALGLGWARPASAFPSSQLVYARGKGAEQCPDEAALRTAVVQRLGYEPFFPWADVTIVARIAPVRGGFVGTVELIDKAGLVKGSRELAANALQCEQLIASMALAISIAIDPDSLDRGGAPPPAAASVVQEPEPTAEFWKAEAAHGVDRRGALRVALAAHEAEPTAEFWKANAAQTEAAPPGPDVPGAKWAPASTKSSKGRFEVSGSFAVSTGYGPTDAYGPGVGVRLRFSSWSLGLEGRYQFVGTTHVPPQVGEPIGFDSSVLDVVLSGCAHGRVLFSCALADVARLEVTGSGIHSPRTASAPIFRAGARAGAEWAFGESFGLRLHADFVINLTRPGVALDGILAWEPPYVGALAGVSLFGAFR